MVEMVLDKGVVIDAQVVIGVIGIPLVEINARVVVASVETYLRFAEAVDRLDITPSGKGGLGGLVENVTDATKGVTSGLGETVGGITGGLGGTAKELGGAAGGLGGAAGELGGAEDEDEADYEADDERADADRGRDRERVSGGRRAARRDGER
ncbi:gas vesicle protein GvpJ [Micromonospora pallida]|uniref:gas vesicle protein GvpJ n=1 Tax=Micromonospora pallida TaxID=145854 RepID=UPI001C40836E|nr:gas vesicle protein GvpJ [Micromonospora pallida]